MSLTAVAQRLGVATPSLNSHIRNLSALRRLVALEGCRELEQAFLEATDTSPGAEGLRRAADSYRTFARDHPGLYEALLPAPAPHEDGELAAAMAAPVVVLGELLRDLGAEPDQAVHLIRALRSTLHGFVTLERDSGFGLPTDVDESWRTTVDLMVRGICEALA
ncbi:TetR-like C-terminal domain-containing protein [Nocardioides sp.]|uniref:TetR-like C-terminal domain-containing protein n=1 Tax=Nocardioides sp. TaxID=35761 RepID=UPI003565FA65